MIEKKKKETFAVKSVEGVGTICHSKCCCQFRRVELMLIGRCRCTYRKSLLVEMIVVNFRQQHHWDRNVVAIVADHLVTS